MKVIVLLLSEFMLVFLTAKSYTQYKLNIINIHHALH